MKKGLNSWTIAGNAGRDPEVRSTSSGKSVANLSVGIGSAWKDSDGNVQEHTEWVDVVCWGKLAEIVGEYVKKGSPVLFEGRAQTRSWDDEKTGTKRYKTELVAHNMIMLGSKTGGAQKNEPGVDSPPLRDEPKDDLPF